MLCRQFLRVTRKCSGAIPNSTVAKVLPALGEKLAAKQADRQQYDQPPSRDPECGLWRASGGGDVYGHRPEP